MKDEFKKYAWTGFAVIFCEVIVVAGAFYFLMGDIASRSNAIAATRVLVAQKNSSLAAFAEIKKDTAEAATYETAMDKLLPAQNDLINFPQWLQNFAATFNVTTNFLFGETVAATPSAPGSIGFSLTAQGSEGDTLSFLKNLESQAPGFLLSFDSVNLTESGSGAKVVVTGEMFFK